jgi:hypothetical protein
MLYLGKSFIFWEAMDPTFGNAALDAFMDVSELSIKMKRDSCSMQ